MLHAKKIVTEIFKRTGITVDGANPWDIHVHNEKFYGRLLGGGSLALGESYMDGWWDCAEINGFMERLLRSTFKTRPNLKSISILLRSKFTNMQTRFWARQAGEKIYGTGYDLYKNMLDENLSYSCGYWKDAADLDEAQINKLDLVCKKLNLKEGQQILDIGCGWGQFLKYAAEKYGVEGVGVTVSKEQAELARGNCKGLPVEIRLQDYRDVNEQFDNIASIGMFEHVGYKNYRKFMRVVHRCLKDKALFLLHTMGQNESTTSGDAWSDKYIFANGMLPSVTQLGKSTENLFVMEDWHNFGPYYTDTLLAWERNFRKTWDIIKDKYDERFYRMWRYYLLSFAGSAKARNIQLWQIAFSKGDISEVYESVR